MNRERGDSQLTAQSVESSYYEDTLMIKVVSVENVNTSYEIEEIAEIVYFLKTIGRVLCDQ